MYATNAQTLKALIIDDETDICYLLSNILKQKNIQSFFAGTLAEADKVLQSHPSGFYLIFIDNNLPDGHGVDQVRRLKKEFPASHLIMITAHDSVTDREKAQLEGIDYFIGKPFSREIIFNTINQFAY